MRFLGKTPPVMDLMEFSGTPISAIDLPHNQPYAWVMRYILPPVTAFLTLISLQAQDLEPLIQRAQTTREPSLLEKRAAELEAQYQFDSALKLREATVSLRGQIDGDQS